ncbi:glycosyltransferase [Enterococcus viikkiensis]|uniref:Glycosyltransferase n=1 Tax=Enterococcus viikkiensis TaxID=930854 RepID=A0ABU3FNQ2_9ENTE|nr:glycosyltransferase [Enterococcus viikkiensis]MDT2827536.1 glycosyltransferase [Enterococcus viikkiensis]
MEKYTTSVVIATYNGEKYVYEQLKSIFNQTLLPDEVIISDDLSTDSTTEIVDKFIKKNDLSGQWKLIRNKKNLGWRKNFIDLIGAASGDIIFTCDQDDVWKPNKLEIMTAQFKQNSEIDVLVSDYDELIENTGKSAKLRSLETEEENGTQKLKFTYKNILLKRPGCVFALAKGFVPEVISYFDNLEMPAHDVAMWGSALVNDGLYYLAEPTIDFRRHENSSFQKEIKSIEMKDSAYQIRINQMKRFNVRIGCALSYLENKNNLCDKDKKKKLLREMLKENDIRIKVLKSKKLSLLLKSASSYMSVFNFCADLKHLLKTKTV